MTRNERDYASYTDAAMSAMKAAGQAGISFEEANLALRLAEVAAQLAANEAQLIAASIPR